MLAAPRLCPRQVAGVGEPTSGPDRVGFVGRFVCVFLVFSSFPGLLSSSSLFLLVLPSSSLCFPLSWPQAICSQFLCSPSPFLSFLPRLGEELVSGVASCAWSSGGVVPVGRSVRLLACGGSFVSVLPRSLCSSSVLSCSLS